MKLYRAFATVGGLTMVSRVLGFVRDMLIAAVLGTGAVADAFFVAFRFPNLFRRLFGEGAFNSAFVPLFAKRLEGEGHDGGAHLRRGSTRRPAFRPAAADGSRRDRHAVADVFAGAWLQRHAGEVRSSGPADAHRVPYLLCMSLVALLSGVLNSLGRFTMAAAAPILLNIVLILAILLAVAWGLGNTPGSGVVLAWGVAAAGAIQLAALWIAVKRAGIDIRLRRPRLNSDLRRLVSARLPGIISGGVTQINIVIGTVIASLQAGAVSHLYYADRLYQLPLGIVGVAIGVVPVARSGAQLCGPATIDP